MKKKNKYDRNRQEKKFKNTSIRRGNRMKNQSLTYADSKYFKHFHGKCFAEEED